MKQQDFINKIGNMAKLDMKNTQILASVTIAQAILESAWGESGLTKRSNNLFGIKGNGIFSRTFEYINGERINCSAKFKKYPSWSASIADHSALFYRLDRYKNLIGCKDYKQTCHNLQKDGYATAPNYATSLIKLIEQYGLTKFDDGDGNINPSPKINIDNKNYTVKNGDSFWRIAKNEMGSGLKYIQLAKYNGLSTKSVIKSGQILKIPK